MIKLGLFVYTKLIYVQISCKMESFYLENYKKSWADKAYVYMNVQLYKKYHKYIVQVQ